MIRSAKPEDAREIAKIYNHYVLHSIVTFAETPVEVAKMQNKIATTLLQLPWLVDERKGRIIGYAYATKWKGRSAYRHSVESTVYLHPDEQGKGIGSQLYASLINELKEKGIHAIIGGISLPNDASIALHEKFGFEKVAHFKEVGLKFGDWIDVGYWELIINQKELKQDGKGEHFSLPLDRDTA